MSLSDDDCAKQTARSEAAKDKAKQCQQAALFLSEVAKIRCHKSNDELVKRSASLIERSSKVLAKSEELRRTFTRKAG
jgi:hypothetical protein